MTIKDLASKKAVEATTDVCAIVRGFSGPEAAAAAVVSAWAANRLIKKESTLAKAAGFGMTALAAIAFEQTIVKMRENSGYSNSTEPVFHENYLGDYVPNVTETST